MAAEGTSKPDPVALHRTCYIWGGVDWERHRDSDNDLTLAYPTPFTALNELKLPICHVTSSQKHTLIVTEDGRCFAFGNNLRGQLGLDPEKVPYSFKPVQIAEGMGHIVHAACGNFHSLLLTKEGKVISFGANNCGQLGTQSRAAKPQRHQPEFVRGSLEPLKVTQVAAGGDLSFALTSDGEPYGWGSIQYGALGLGTDGKTIEARKELFADEERPVHMSWFNKHGHTPLVKIAAGQRHFLALSHSRQLLTCGHGAFGRLGQGTDTKDKLTPTTVTIPSKREIKVTDIFCGEEHNLALVQCGEHVFVYLWGRPGTDADGVMTPELVNEVSAKGVTHAGLGRGFTICCNADGEAAVWGANSLCSGLGLFGQPKRGKDRTPNPLELLQDKHVTAVYGGGWHLLAFVDPERSTGPVDLTVPQEGRLYKGFGGKPTAPKRTWEESVELFDAKCKGVAVAAPAAKKGEASSKPKPAPKAKRSAPQKRKKDEESSGSASDIEASDSDAPAAKKPKAKAKPKPKPKGKGK